MDIKTPGGDTIPAFLNRDASSPQRKIGWTLTRAARAIRMLDESRSYDFAKAANAVVHEWREVVVVQFPASSTPQRWSGNTTSSASTASTSTSCSRSLRAWSSVTPARRAGNTPAALRLRRAARWRNARCARRGPQRPPPGSRRRAHQLQHSTAHTPLARTRSLDLITGRPPADQADDQTSAPRTDPPHPSAPPGPAQAEHGRLWGGCRWEYPSPHDGSGRC